MFQLRRQQLVPRSVSELFTYFSRAENLQCITPTWLHFDFVGEPPSELHAGTLIYYRLRWRGVPVRWTTRITAWDPPHGFVDEQIAGPYRHWRHQHRFEPRGPNETLMTDIVDYALPLGFIGRATHALLVRRDVAAIFDFRARTIAQMFG